MAVMYGAQHALQELLQHGIAGPNHFFVPANDFAYKFELGGVSHEGCAGLCGLSQYLNIMAVGHRQGKQDGTSVEAEADGRASKDIAPLSNGLTRQVVIDAFAAFALMEQPLQERLLSYLAGCKEVVVLGPVSAQPLGRRVATISFIHRSKSSEGIARDVQAQGFAIRNGHMYAKRLLQNLALKGGDDISVNDGVVRISMLHYNTPAEVDKLITALDNVL